MNVISKAATAAAACLMIAVQPVAAQRASDIRAGISPIAQAVSQPDFSAIEAEIKESYWKEGAIIGAVSGAIALCAWACFYPGSRASVVEVALGMLAAGTVTGTVGALIGGQFPKGDTKMPEYRY